MNRNRFLKFSTALALGAILAGCASGAKYSDMASSMPSIKPGEGRIYFIRERTMVGAAVQPDVRLNGAVVGSSKPGGFFWIDRPAGSYAASTTTEVENVLNFSLAAGETKYVRTSVAFGLAVGRVNVTLESPDAARAELAGLSYTGAPGAR